MSVCQICTDSDYVFAAITSGLDIYGVAYASGKHAYINSSKCS